MQYGVKAALSCVMLAALTGCGLRGDLDRPPPIFSDPPSEEAQKPVDAPAHFAGTDIIQDKVYFNALGGEIPKPAPTLEVEEDSMGEVSPG